MALRAFWDLIQTELFPLPSTADLFNQYRDEDPAVDLPDAHQVRQDNLKGYLATFSSRHPILVVGEAAGPWGCRFSGVAFTGERQLLSCPAFPSSGRQSSRNDPQLDLSRKRQWPPYTSGSAEAFWDVMRQYHRNPGFLVWDLVPCHPHDVGDTLSVRTPRGDEVRKYRGLVVALVELVAPEVTVAVGREAESALCELGLECVYVRHPSHGGKEMFRAGMEEVFSRYK